MSDFPVITLTTDFGLNDHYVATMKGVIFSGFPQARIVDITHGIEPFSIWSGAYAISQAAPYFPRGTVHVVVVDPGVGSARMPIAAEVRGQIFIAPDNGALTMILDGEPNATLREIANRELWLDRPSATFHGRDVFAPVAAAIASGRALIADVGPKLPSAELLPGLHPIEEEQGCWRGRILSVDRFGNLVTNFRSKQFANKPFQLQAGGIIITERRTTFSDADPGLLFVYSGSSGYEEIGANQENAAGLIEVGFGDAVRAFVR